MPAGQQDTYTNTVPQKRVVSDRLLLTDPNETVLINALGLNNESKFAFVNTPGRVYEWLEQKYNTRTLTATASGLHSDSTTTTMSVADGTLVNVGDLLLLDSETVHVASKSTNTLTIVRNIAGTQATHHTSTVTITIVGNARIEGADANDSPYTLATSTTNVSQILQRSVEISRTDQRLKRYGVPSLVDREIDMRLDELTQLLSMSPYYNGRVAGSSGVARIMGGLGTYITTNVTDASSAALTQKMIEDQVAACWGYGGKPSLIVCNSWAKRKIADMYSGYVRTERSETLGGITIDEILTPLGLRLSVAVDRFCPTNKLYLLDKNYVGYITLDAFFYEELAKTGDTAANGQVVGEYGFVVAHEKSHAIIHSFSTTA